jgi:cytochrome oxidase Cu insertion factor (SCO1/SenC/PrrC family)
MLRALLFSTAVAVYVIAAPDTARSHDSHAPPLGGARTADYAFPLAEPGSYRLPPIKPAAGGSVLDENGHRHELGDLIRGRVTVLAFIYTRCADLCPAATLDLSRLQDLAAKDRVVASASQLVTMSFDPEHDTPEVMGEYAAQWRAADGASPEWFFLTAPDQQTIVPMLAAYDQQVSRMRDSASPSSSFSHIFRAFLIDRAGVIRNIYSLDFFDPVLVLNDVRTLLVDGRAGAKR